MNIKIVKILMLTIDIGLLIYWTITALHILPMEWAFRDYTNPIMIAWNWSFFPLDFFAILTGILWSFSKLPLARKNLMLLISSLVLTFIAGMMAISFWAISGDFDPMWWLPNSFLMLVPVVIFYLLRKEFLKE